MADTISPTVYSVFQYQLLTAYWVLTGWELPTCDTLLFHVHIQLKVSLNKFFHFLNF